MLEKDFQRKLKHEIKERFPESIICKTDPHQMQGMPDLLILNGNKWAAIEVKRSSTASRQPNQELRVSQMNGMSYASFCCPENMEDVLNDLERLFEV